MRATRTSTTRAPAGSSSATDRCPGRTPLPRANAKAARRQNHRLRRSESPHAAAPWQDPSSPSPPPRAARWASCAPAGVIWPLIEALCAPGARAADGDLRPFLAADGGARPGPGHHFRRRTPHRRRRCSNCRRTAARAAAAAAGALPAGRNALGCAWRAGRVHRARLPQRQARPRPGRGGEPT